MLSLSLLPTLLLAAEEATQRGGFQLGSFDPDQRFPVAGAADLHLHHEGGHHRPGNH